MNPYIYQYDVDFSGALHLHLPVHAYSRLEQAQEAKTRMKMQSKEETVKGYRRIGIVFYNWSQHDSGKWHASADDGVGGKYLLVVTTRARRPQYLCEVIMQNVGGASHLIHVSRENELDRAMETAEKIASALVAARLAA